MQQQDQKITLFFQVSKYTYTNAVLKSFSHWGHFSTPTTNVTGGIPLPLTTDVEVEVVVELSFPTDHQC